MKGETLPRWNKSILYTESSSPISLQSQYNPNKIPRIRQTYSKINMGGKKHENTLSLRNT